MFPNSRVRVSCRKLLNQYQYFRQLYSKKDYHLAGLLKLSVLPNMVPVPNSIQDTIHNSHCQVNKIGLKRNTQCGSLHTSAQYLAGHSQWANRKHGKEIKDKQKSSDRVIFVRQVMAVIKQSREADPKYNPKLQSLIQQAKLKDIPKSVVDNILKQATTKSYEVVVIEAVLPGNMYMILEVSTTSAGSTIGQFKNIFKQVGGYVEPGCCKQIFDEKGVVDVEVDTGEKVELDKYVDMAIEAGAEDVILVENEDEKYLRFICEVEDLYQVKGKLEKMDLKIINYINEYKPYELIAINDAQKAVLKSLWKKLDSNLLSDSIDREFTNYVEHEEN